MTRKPDKGEAAETDVEFIPSEKLIEAMPEATKGEHPPQDIQEDGQGLAPAAEVGTDPGATAPPPDRYRVLRPWAADTLQDRLNEAAAEGWHLAHVVNGIIILER